MATRVPLADMSRMTRAILGMSLNVSHGVDQEDALREGLRRTQSDLWVMYDWPSLITRVSAPVAPGVQIVDIPVELDFEHINSVWTRTANTDRWVELTYGIGPCEMNIHDSAVGVRADPILNYQATASDPHKVEIWPVPMTAQNLMFVGRTVLLPLIATDDVCTLDADLIVSMYASQQLARQNNADAQIQVNKAQAILNRLRGRQGASKRQPFVVQTLLAGGSR